MAQTDERKIVFVIPAFNEERNIEALLASTIQVMEKSRRPYRIFVVDDGSADRTAQMVKKAGFSAPVSLLSQGQNLGVGEAFKRGFKAALSELSDDDILVTKEADNTSDLTVLEAMLGRIEEGYDLALASCYAEGGGVEGTTPVRRILSGGANLLLRAFCPVDGVRTYSSFYRAYRGKLVREAQARYGENLFEEKGFACMVDLLLKLHELGARVVEVPMVLRANKRLDQSKMKRVQTIAAYLVLIGRSWTRRVLGRRNRGVS